MAKGIITLCGSTRFREQFEDAYMWLTLRGYIVLSVGSFHNHDKTDPAIIDLTLRNKPALDRLHKDKIRMSDAVMIIDVPLPDHPDGYVGDSTKSEIIYALRRHLPIYSYTATKGERFEWFGYVKDHVIRAWISK